MNLSVNDAAQLLSVSQKSIYRWIKQGTLPAYKISGCYRFSRTELLEWATSQRRGELVNVSLPQDTELLPLPSISSALESGGVFYRIEGRTREEVLTDAVNHLRLTEDVDRGALLEFLRAREELASTAIGHGVAIPHPRNPNLLNAQRAKITLCFLDQPVDFFSFDGQLVKVLLLVIAPDLRSHLHLISRLGFVLQDPEFRKTLDNEENREKIFAALAKAEGKLKA
ncbi:PTS IIA-like nitrogen-regulatory protein PtsN [Desulfuromusa kysingii]|uniref:PTS IIA-like nitrogen-regulatory protein PtsN n=1 Tax=Desulfuromusa kysingii TaxID=37625 RepID=A0A1H4E6X6_9BACT|nr:PTS sugar transporter subunit IIA [Desulfuromusa kysingii]SEA80488.1 PTS IIA-like nitrogen-regulatory protein PtsN [Desulfuromusa kysingii]